MPDTLSRKTALAVVILLIVTCGFLSCGCGGSGSRVAEDRRQASESDTAQPGELTRENWETFLSAGVTLIDDTGDENVENLADMALSYIREQDPLYTGGELPEPSIGYYRTDFDGRQAESFYLYWLPDNWNGLPVKKSIFFSHGHGQREPVGFSKLHRYAVERDMALFMPQIWVEGEPPAGYSAYRKTPKDEVNGLPDGYHLSAEDQRMFLGTLVSEYRVESVYAYGFSISGSTVIQMAAFDHYGPNVIDLVVVSGGTMGYDHHFLDTMADLGREGFFAGENFFVFGEYRGGASHEAQEAEYEADDIIVENGGNLLMYEWRDVPHGGLLNQLPELMEESLDLYDRLAAERIGG